MKSEFASASSEPQSAESPIQDKADGYSSPGRPTPLTSGLSLSAQVEPPLVCLDAFQLADALKGPSRGHWQNYDLPYDVNGAFQTKTLGLSPDGKFTVAKRKTLAGSGSAIVRIQHGLLTPLCDGDLKNQLTAEELNRLVTVNVHKHPALSQVHWLMQKWEKLVDFLEKEVSEVRVGAQTFAWFEVYREYPIVGDEQELHHQLQKVFNQIYSEYGVNKDRRGRRSRKNGSLLSYDLPVPDTLIPYSGRYSAVHLKLYRKDDKLRIEISFRNLAVPKFPRANGVTASKQNAVLFMTEFAEMLIDEGVVLLDKIHQELFSEINDLDVSTLRKKLRDDLRLRGVDGQDKCIELMITDLATKGTYTPADHPANLRVKGDRLCTLRDPAYGVLEEVPRPYIKVTQAKTYRLKRAWKGTPPRPARASPKTKKLGAELRALLLKLALTEEQRRVLDAELGESIENRPDDLN